MKKIILFAAIGLILPTMLLATEPMSKKGEMPEYGNWKTYTTKDGLPANKIFCVRTDGDRVWIGTSHGLVLYENEDIQDFYH